MSDIPAFPIKDFPYMTSHDGLSMRDYFAAKAMQGLVANSNTNPMDIAKAAYVVADFMMKAREA
jgi:hypothetical protein